MSLNFKMLFWELSSEYIEIPELCLKASVWHPDLSLCGSVAPLEANHLFGTLLSSSLPVGRKVDSSLSGGYRV